MVADSINYTFSLLGFLLFNIPVITVEVFIYILCAFGDEKAVVDIKWKKGHTISFIIYFVLLHLLFVGGMIRMFSSETRCISIGSVNSIDFDGEKYTINNDQYVNYNKVWYDNDIDNSYIVDSRNEHSCWVFGIDKYTVTKELMLCEKDYKKFFSDDIKPSSYNSTLKVFVYSKLELDGKLLTENDSVRANQVDNSEDINESQDVATKEFSNNDSEKLDGIAEQIALVNKNINDLHANVNSITSELDRVNTELESQKQTIEEVQRKDKVNINPVVLIVSFFGFWIMVLITIITLVNIRTKSKRDLILAASDAKIREGVMLEDDKTQSKG